MGEPLVVTIPMTPPVELSPNARVHWAKRARLARPLREAAYYATREALAGRESREVGFRVVPPGRVALRLHIRWEWRRRLRDEDNAIASCKAIIDGVADALGVNDKEFRVLGVAQDKATKADPGGWVRVTLETREPEEAAAC